MQILFTADRVNYSKNIKPKTPVFGAIKRIKKINYNSFDLELVKNLKNHIEKYDYKTKKPVQWAAKRTFDYTAATVGIMATSPIMLLAAIAIKLDSKGPVIFKQTRIGQYGKPFTMYKFRTMVVNQDNPALKRAKNDPRITRVGKFLRKYSIDELPQLFNVLKGDISLTGPRSLPINCCLELLENKPETAKRFTIKQGATLNYNRKKDLTLGERFHTEDSYIENWNLLKDVKHFFGIIKDIITGNNI